MMKKMSVGLGGREEKKKKKKEEQKKKKREMIILKSESKPDKSEKYIYIYIKQNVKNLIMMMIKIWFRYTMNNEVFK